MRKSFPTLAAFALVCLFSATAQAAANFVYHEQSDRHVATPTDDPGGGCGGEGTDTSCGRYVENADRSASPGFQIYSPETYGLHFKVEYQSLTDRRHVYYTTDGSTPGGKRGVPTGTTRVATGTLGCNYSDASRECRIGDVISASIPPQAPGTTVRYIIGAYLNEGGEEVFVNTGGVSCVDCQQCLSGTAGCATVFEYNVLAVPSTPLIISEFRLRGPGADGTVPSADDDDDEFVEIYNNSNSPVTVNAFDGSDGFALAAADGITRFIIPNGTFIPARGHYLGVNPAGYSLGAYPAATRPATGGGTNAQGAPAPTGTDAPSGKSRLRAKAAGASAPRPAGGTREPDGADIPGTGAAAGDTEFTIQIADNVGIALFNTSNPLNFSEATRLDAVGSTSEENTLFKEGAGYPAIIPLSINYSFFRDMCGKGGSTTASGGCTSGGNLSDAGDNASDFLFTDTNGTDAGAGSRLGAPGPENSTSPVQRNEQFSGSLIFNCVPSSAPPNRERTLGAGPPATSTFGTLSVRRRLTNNTGFSIKRLRFRVIDISTTPAPTGTADLRVLSSSLIVVENPCTSLPTTIQGTTLETPPMQSNGGGFNSSLSAGTITLVTPLLPGGTYDYHLMLGIKQTGRFKFYLNIEALQ